MGSISTNTLDSMLLSAINHFVDTTVSAEVNGTVGSMEVLNARVEALQLAMRALERTCNTIETTIFRLAKERNALAPIHRLPVETLSEILGSLLSESEIWGTEQFYPMDRFLLSNVCSYWTQILNEPAHWSYISAAFPKQVVELSLKKSVNHPLRVVWPLEPIEGSPRFIQDLLPHANRWRALELVIREDDDYAGLFPLPHAPMLETLDLRVYGGRKPAIPAPISNDVLPRLRYLYVAWFNIDLNVRHIPSLISLTLEGFDTGKITVSIMLDILSGLPCLEDLHLEATRFQDTTDIDGISPNHESLSMSRLAEVQLHGLAPEYSYTLLSHLTLPNLPKFEFHYLPDGSVSDEGHSPITNLVLDWMKESHDPIAWEVELRGHNMSVIATRGPVNYFNLSIVVFRPDDMEGTLSLSKHFVSNAWMAHSCALRIHAVTDVMMPVRRILNKVTPIQELVLSPFSWDGRATQAADISAFLQSLADRRSFSDETGLSQESWLLPDLESIKISSEHAPELYCNELLGMLENRYGTTGTTSQSVRGLSPLRRLQIKGIDIETAKKVEDILGSGILTDVE